MIFRWCVVLVCVTLLLPALAVAADLDPEGRPATMRRAPGPKKKAPPRAGQAFHIWVDKDGWHLRTTTRGLHRFSGRISVDGGTFTDLKNANADSRRRGTGGDGDRGHVSEDKLHINFGMRTEADIDGFDFKVSDDAKSLKFDLKIDNDPANQKKIIIGAKMQNPENNIFDVPVVKVTE